MNIDTCPTDLKILRMTDMSITIFSHIHSVHVIMLYEKKKNKPAETIPCLLIANGRHANGFHVNVLGSKVSTLLSTTLSSSPPTATITSVLSVTKF